MKLKKTYNYKLMHTINIDSKDGARHAQTQEIPHLTSYLCRLCTLAGSTLNESSHCVYLP